MLLPIRTNVWPRTKPYANYALIAANVVAFLLTFGPHQHSIGWQAVGVPVQHWAEHLMLVPASLHPWQLISYAFLHGGLWHILGNMFFLYLFGNNVNDRLGHFWYILFYLAGAVASGLGHVALHASSTAPTLGASGAVAAVTGAYLVLFPQTLITVAYWFFFIGTVDVPALYFIGFKMILFDNLIDRTGFTAVAYDAHVAGYLYGILLILGLLAVGLIPSHGTDLWHMLRHWNRRRAYRDTVAGGCDPFTGAAGRKPITVRQVDTPIERPSAKELQVREILDEIRTRLAQRNLAAAADLYVKLMAMDAQQVLPLQALLDIANQLASEQRSTEAAWAYEQFLAHYGSYEHSGQVALMLGLLYARYLHRKSDAIQCLRRAIGRLSDEGQVRMCREELARLEGPVSL
jgi:membrane associated rhomboid family serine protease